MRVIRVKESSGRLRNVNKRQSPLFVCYGLISLNRISIHEAMCI